MRRILVVLLVVAAMMPVAAWAMPREFDYGFLASRLRTPQGEMRLRVLGPIYEKVTDDQGREFTALRPLFNTRQDPAASRRNYEVLWPVASGSRFQKQHSMRVLLAFYLNHDVTNPKSRYRFWILPIYFQGRNEEGNPYLAIFPLGGRIHNILGRDQVDFFMFPLFMRSSVNGLVTRDVLWPIFSHTRGRGIHRYRFFPFYGYSRTRDRSTKRFIMWPIWTSAHYEMRGARGNAFVLFPLYGRIRLENERTTLLLPPFFRFSRGDRVNHVYAPWPFIQRSSGAIERFSVWPIYGRRRSHGNQSSYFLWPIFRRYISDRGSEVSRRYMIVPIFHYEVRAARNLTGDDEMEVSSRTVRVWPLASYERQGDAARFRMLELWPVRNSGPIERNYAPFWSLFTHTRVGDSREDELLWGLYRYQSTEGKRKRMQLFPIISWERDRRENRDATRWSILKGLIGYEREDSRRRLRLLYFLRFGRKEQRQ